MTEPSSGPLTIAHLLLTHDTKLNEVRDRYHVIEVQSAGNYQLLWVECSEDDFLALTLTYGKEYVWKR